jgi:hypothetical protein
MSDDLVNFASTVVQVAPIPADSGTTMTLVSGPPSPTPPYDLTCWFGNAAPTYNTAEIVRVTAQTGNVITAMERAQYETSALDISDGWNAAQILTAAMLGQLQYVQPCTVDYSAAVAGPMYLSGHPFVVAASAPSLPLTVVADANDGFVYTPIASGTPDTFIIAPGTYTTGLELAAAMGAALDSFSDVFGNNCPVQWNGSAIVVTSYNYLSSNGDTLTTGAHDVLASLGFTSPATFAGGGPGTPGVGGALQFSYNPDAAYGLFAETATSVPVKIPIGGLVCGWVQGDIDLELFGIDTTDFSYTFGFSLVVTNLTGTEIARMDASNTIDVVGPDQNGDCPAGIGTPTIVEGSDLSWNADLGGFFSAAGGTFVVSMMIYGAYNA